MSAAYLAKHVRDFEALLRLAGRPLSRTELLEPLLDSTPPPPMDAFYDLHGLRPFVECDSQHWGLIDRDLPGADLAFQAALDALHAEQQRLQRALQTVEARLVVRRLSQSRGRWSHEMIASTLRYLTLRGRT